MSRTLDVLQTPSARALRTFCYTLARELGLTLDSVGWGCAEHPEHRQNPYNLTLRITQPFEWDRVFWFMGEQVCGYATGATKTAIEDHIRTDLEASCRLWSKGTAAG